MKWWVLPPHRDVTLVPETPEGWQPLDLARGLTRRVFAAEAIEAEAQAREGAPPTPRSMRELLLLRVAQGLRARGPLAELRALGAVLTALSSPSHGVRLRLDDVELETGTTERSADVERAATLSTPYAPEVATFAARVAGAERVRLWLERDLQLPAAVALAQVCPAEVALEVAGPFAETHRDALARMPSFQRATFPEHVPPLRWRVVPLEAEPSREAIVWLSDARRLEAREASLLERARALTGGARWAGHVSLNSLATPDVLVESGCHTAVVEFCAITPEHVVDIDHQRIPRALLHRGFERLQVAGVRVVAEWWVGAPGMDASVLDSTAAALEDETSSFFDALAGVRPFHLSVERLARNSEVVRGWGVPGTPPVDRDLRRSVPIERPGTISAAQLQEVLTSLAGRLSSRAPLSPGRVAGAFLALHSRWERGPATHLRLDSDCAVVRLPASLEGGSTPSWYAANLRTGVVLAMDARMAPELSRRTEPAPLAEVLSMVPEARRAKWAETLVSKSILERTRG
ncbi:hypothetical protein MYSTI_05010 [Myxococcus stipitatus DSM 14675]|uniref:Uncharacterized protein n=1 Tax=Myxococcus stipitatus (strain DSM 14675 / JCM 12634 / Mx s8) TaxID=1278073 RepID=L7UE10_MYXSD|nr:hypothetical protein [Myxococcus stipitatus]AGC46298.1 hypothetical protein MYSTI_05010 [Myxococcus stipitatus DSM 14675]